MIIGITDNRNNRKNGKLVWWILKIRNEIDEKLNSIIDNINENDVIVLDYSLLEDYYIFERCDLLIKTDSNSKEIAIDEIELLKK